VLPLSQDFDFIAYLDADNWFHPSHLASLLTLFENTQANVCHSLGSLNHVGEGLSLISEGVMDPLGCVDVNCLMFHKSAFKLLSLWLEMPKQLWPICAKVFWEGIRDRGFLVSSTERRSVVFRSKRESHYEEISTLSRRGSNEYQKNLRNTFDYLNSAAGRKETFERLGWVPVINGFEYRYEND